MIRIDPPPAPWWHRLRRRLRRHRRPAAALLAAAAAAMLSGQAIAVARPPMGDVVVMASPVAAGATVTPHDVDIGRWPVELIPPLALRTATQAVGRTAVGRLSPGEPVTPARLADPVTSVDLADRVLVVVGLADPWSLALVSPGSRVDVHAPASSWVDGAAAGVAGSPVAVAAVVVRVLGARPSTLDGAADGSGLVGPDLVAPDLVAPGPLTDDLATTGIGGASGAALVLAVRPPEAAGLAGLSGQGFGISTTPGPAAAG